MSRKYFGTDGIRGRTNEGLMTAEIAMRVPAYEPGPSPTVIVSGAPNFLCTAWRFSKNAAEFCRSLGHLRVNSISPSSQARLPREVESSSARVFMIVMKQRYDPLTLRFYFKGNPAGLLWNQIREAIGPFDH